MRIGVVQFDPKLGEVETNIEKAKELTAHLEPNTLDLLVFPELAFTGYCFPSLDAITPFLEDPQTGPTSLLCRSLAKRLRCYVTAGYPQKMESTSAEPRKGWTGAANSAMMIAPDGSVIGNYSKTNMFEMDKSWATPGTGFKSYSLHLPSTSSLLTSGDYGQGETTFAQGICMDLNPQPPTDWTSSGGPFELADFVRSPNVNAKVLILNCAWLDSAQPESTSESFGADSEEEDNTRVLKGKGRETDWDFRTIEYWMARLRPLWDSSCGDSYASEVNERIVVVCNRTGLERGSLFAGCSLVMRMSRTGEGPELIGTMKKREEGVRVWTV